MTKNFITFFLLFSSVFAYPSCCPDLEPALRAVYHFPEGQKLLKEVESEGPIQIYHAPFAGNSHAMWIANSRVIIININHSQSFGETIRSIFFELCNAKMSHQFAHLDWLASKCHISKSNYVEAVERLEHQNAHYISCLINQAITLNYFPSDTYWPISPNFQTHLEIQKKMGHSGNIAAIYNSLSYKCEKRSNACKHYDELAEIIPTQNQRARATDGVTRHS